MKYTNQELREIYEKVLHIKSHSGYYELRPYSEILTYILDFAPLFDKEVETNNFDKSYQFMRELIDLFNSIDKKKIKLINETLLEYVSFCEYVGGVLIGPTIKKLKCLIIPNEMVKEDIVNYVDTMRNLFLAGTLDCNNGYFYGNDYNNFVGILDYYNQGIYKRGGFIPEYLCLYFYANNDRYDDMDILEKMLNRYYDEKDAYDNLLYLLTGINVDVNDEIYFSPNNIKMIYDIIAYYIVPNLLSNEKKLMKKL